jgi:hypothetical protein
MFCAAGLVFGGIEGVRPCFHVLRAWTLFRWYQGRRVPFSCFSCPSSFSTVPRALGSVFMFCAPGLIFGVTEGIRSRFRVLCARTSFRGYRGRRVPFICFALSDSVSTVPRASGSFFMFCAPRLVFGSTEGVRYLFHVLRSHIRFRQYRERTMSFSCFARPNSFSAEPRASGPVFIFPAPGLVFGGTEGVGSHFHVLRAQTHFRRCRVRQVPFSAVTRALGLVFMFCSRNHF